MLSRLFSHFLRRDETPSAPLSGAPTFEAALRRLSDRQIEVRSVIDVGASNGSWTRALMPYYPAARYLCIEAQQAHGASLRGLASGRANIDVVLAAAGDREGEIFFDAGDLFGGIASETLPERNGIIVPVTTVDAQVDRLNLRPPFLIKLDTHGFEPQILAGAAETLKQASVLVIEAYNFDITAGAIRFPELCARLEAKGFRCIDLFDVMYRPSDGALWQVDLVFIRSDRPEFHSNAYA